MNFVYVQYNDLAIRFPALFLLRFVLVAQGTLSLVDKGGACKVVLPGKVNLPVAVEHIVTARIAQGKVVVGRLGL
jgi:hypothetical protein